MLTTFILASDRVDALRNYLSTYDPVDVPEGLYRMRALVAGAIGSGPPVDRVPLNFLLFYIVVPAALVFPATFLLGSSFPVLQRVVQTDLGLIGRRVGLLLVANVAGSVVGTLLTGWWLLDVLGTSATFKLLAALSGLFATLAVYLLARSGPVTLSRGAAPALVAAVVTALVIAPVLIKLPASKAFWARLHGATANQIFFAEDRSGLAVIKIEGPSLTRPLMFVNGLGQSSLPYGGIHTALGALPAFLHPSPNTAAVIGLGSGDTVHAVAGRVDIQRITSIEIVRPQLDTLKQLQPHFGYPGLNGLLANPRVEHIFGDGRIHLMRSGRAYDLIEADALRPNSAYAGNLSSEEFFKLVRAHLSPRGLAATWVPTGRVSATFIRVFPY